MSSVHTAVFAGLAAGAFNGALCRWLMRRALGSSDAVFFSVFAGGLLYRLAFLVCAVWSLRSERYIIIISFALPLIALQLLFEAVPIKSNGTKANS